MRENEERPKVEAVTEAAKKAVEGLFKNGTLEHHKDESYAIIWKGLLRAASEWAAESVYPLTDPDTSPSSVDVSGHTAMIRAVNEDLINCINRHVSIEQQKKREA